MRQDRLTSSLTRLTIVLAILLFGASAAATATPNRLLLQSEESFRDQLGDRAVPIAEGVYQVDLPSGERIRVAFGQKGMKHDIAWLRAEIDRLSQNGNGQATTGRPRLLTRALTGLEQQMAEQKRPLESPRSITANASQNGTVCNGYSYYLDGGHSPWLVGGTTWGEASVGKPDTFTRVVAYSYAGATDEYNNFYYDDDTDNTFEFAVAAASTDCGYASWSCPTWESFNWIRSYACSDGYRSIYRNQNNP